MFFLEKSFHLKSLTRVSSVILPFLNSVILLFSSFIVFNSCRVSRPAGKIHPIFHGLATRVVNHGYMITVSLIKWCCMTFFSMLVALCG